MSAETSLAAPDPNKNILRSIQRLSFDLRGRRLDAEETLRVNRAIEAGQSPKAMYSDHLARWLDEPAFTRLAEPFSGGQKPTSSEMFIRLRAYERPEGPLLYLPHRSAKDAPPCTPDDVVSVRPWWSKRPVQICKNSYVPEATFDEVGFCAGMAGPVSPLNPRPGCACGPALLSCLPPESLVPGLEDRLDSDMYEELTRTTVQLILDDKPFDGILTASRTWQSGAVEFLYLRRELIAMLRNATFDAKLEKSIYRRLDTVDLESPGRWRNRSSIYAGTGLYWTPPAIQTRFSTYRMAVSYLFSNVLCVNFSSVRVDRDSMLQTVGAHSTFTALSSIRDSPMRKQQGCNGCHRPIDGVAAFLVGLEQPNYGSHPNHADTSGDVYVRGANDYRGKGVGNAALSKLVAALPEFEDCAMRTIFKKVMNRPVATRDSQSIESLTRDFHGNGHRMKPIIQRLFMSPEYLCDSATPDPSCALSASAKPLARAVSDETGAKAP